MRTGWTLELLLTLVSSLSETLKDIKESVFAYFLLDTLCFRVSMQALDGGKSASQHHSLLMAANQAAVISAAKNTSATGGGSSLSKAAVASLVKGAGNPAAIAKTAGGSAGAVVTGAKGITNMPVISMSKGVGTVVGVPKSSSSSGASLVSATSLVSGVAAAGGKTGAALSGRQKEARFCINCQIKC